MQRFSASALLAMSLRPQILQGRIYEVAEIARSMGDVLPEPTLLACRAGAGRVRRRTFIAMALGATVCPVVARTQQPLPVVGYIGFGSSKGFATRLTAFRRGLEEMGYREGDNVAIVYRWAEGDETQLPSLAADLAGRGVTVIATPGSANAARAAKAATATIPIVFETGADPVAAGLVTTLNRPIGNVTGVISLNVEVGQKRLELLRELLPNAKVVAALVNPINLNAQMIVKELNAAASSFRFALHILHASKELDFETAFKAVRQVSADALIVNPDPFFFGQSDRLVSLTLERRIITMFFSRDFVRAGGLMSYGGSVSESHRQAGIYTARILKGEKPADLPVQQVTKFELAINVKTAKDLGVVIPPPIIARADELIE